MIATPNDLAKSLNILIKYNDGLWKSTKQGRFIHHAVRDLSTAAAVQWARATGRWDAQDRNQRALQIVLLDQRFGRTDPTKIRYNGQFFLIDGQGVVARASVKVDAKTMQPKATTARTTFLREARGESIDPAGEQDQRDRQRTERIAKNRDLIEKIRAIPSFNERDILQDFVKQLERGDGLSAKQMAIVERYLPAAIIEFDADDLEAAMRRLDQRIERVVIPVMIDVFAEVDEQQYRIDQQQRDRGLRGPVERDDTPAKIRRWWTDYRAGKIQSAQSQRADDWLWGLIEQIFRDGLRFNWWQYIRGSSAWAGYPGLRAELAKALPKLRRGRPTAKRTAQWLRVLMLAAQRIDSLDAAKVERVLRS